MNREQQTPWCGLAYLEEHGLPGYPPPRESAPSITDEHADRILLRAIRADMKRNYRKTLRTHTAGAA